MKICDENKCTGCMACANICPQKCITMQYNDVFELHPVINEKCISCGRCKAICPSNNADKHKNITQACYAAYSITHRDGTSSGGIASTLSKYFIDNDGVVCGCIFDGKAHHVVTTDEDVILAMRGSKYVQSVLGDCYMQIKKIVSSKKCLFIGTPCQVAALKNIVGESDNLFCVDLICHGVPSPRFLSDILEQYERVTGVIFREKNEFVLKINGSETKRTERYMAAFLNEMSYRESCYQCQFAENRRVGDITLGDFWEIEKFTDTEKGVSCVLVNNEKGCIMLDSVKHNLYLEKRDLKEAYAGNPQLNHPSVKHGNRSEFLRILRTTGDFDQAAKRTLKKELFKNWLKRRYIIKCLLKWKYRRAKK